MSRRFAAISRYRPRVLTLVVLFVVATLIALENLCCELIPGSFGAFRMGGWPVRWYRYPIPDPNGGFTWGCTASPLAANLAMWLVLLAAPGAVSEWLLRRYRPRLRWSVQTLLAFVALAAAFCGWLAAARDRANKQDPLIAACTQRWWSGLEPSALNGVWVHRWGPKWFELVGADRFARQIVGADVESTKWADDRDRDGEPILERLADLPRLRYLVIQAEELTPAMTNALRRMRQIRLLSIDVDRLTPDLVDLPAQLPNLRILSIGQSNSYSNEPPPDEYLAVIGRIAQLEVLRLGSMVIEGESLRHLAGLTNLKSLTLDGVRGGLREPPKGSLLAHLPALPRLEAVNLQDSHVSKQDLRRLALLPRLKSLNLAQSGVGSADLAELASLESLEELAIDQEAVSAAGLEALLAVKRLKRLHLGHTDCDRPDVALPLDQGFEVDVPKSELDRCVRALAALRQSNRGLVVDRDYDALEWAAERMIPPEYDTIPGARYVWALEYWNAQQ